MAGIAIAHTFNKTSRRLNFKISLINHGVPERIRTSDLPLRRGLRYPSVPPGREVIKDTGKNAKTQSVVIFS